MNRLTCTRRLEIDAGHRLIEHESKCRNVHGHRYVFEITCAAEGLDKVGRIVDFGVVKREVGGWLEKYLDHAFIAQRGDAIGEKIEEAGLPVYWMAVAPTAENLAGVIFGVTYDLLAPYHIDVVKVRCWETPNCWAEFEQQPNPLPRPRAEPQKKATWG